MLISVLLTIFSISLKGQTLQNGCNEALFGIDADTRANISYFGNVAALSTITDDWFSIRSITRDRSDRYGRIRADF